jgi:hypothetical protein
MSSALHLWVSMAPTVRASISASRAARSYMSTMKNWSRSPVLVAGSGAASRAVMALVVRWRTGGLFGLFFCGTPVMSAKCMARVGSAVAA